MRWKQLLVIATIEVLGMAVWFSASAVVPVLREEWDVSGAEAAWLTISVQLGFVLGALTSAVLNLADVVSTRRFIAAGALLGAATTAAFALWADGLGTGIALRLTTGLGLAAVYPPGIKFLASWFRRDRGLAVGVLVGALSIGSGAPHLIGALPTASWQTMLGVASGLALLAAALALALLREGPYARPSPPLAPAYALKMFRDRAQRLVNFGYFGHMWELYAMWAWLPSFLAASFAARQPGVDADLLIDLTTFAAIAVAGFSGCVIAGLFADRLGRATVTIACLGVSGLSCLLSAPLYGAAPWAVVVLVVIWGAAIISDSAQYSASLSELANSRYVGTALTVQTAVGFLVTVVPISLVPVLANALGWRYAFVLLAIGPALGILAMLKVRRGRYLAVANPRSS